MASPQPYDLFIAHAADDRAWVDGYLLQTLRQAGVRCFTESLFTLGAPRVLEFERAVKQSQRTLLILSPAYLSDDFTAFLDVLAQSYGLELATWPIVPLILRQVTLPPRLAMLTALDATDPDEWETAIARLSDSLEVALAGPPPLPPCPYQGMVPFAEADARRFFGRDDEIQDVLDRLRLYPFLTVIGRSGSGKSSLVFAGVLPRLRASGAFGPGSWLVRTLRPGAMPLVNLATALAGNPIDPLANLTALLASDPDAQRLLVVVDQLEETWALAPDEAELFAQVLLRLAQTPRCFVILTVRADFYPDLMTSALWPEIQSHRVEVVPLTDQGLRRAIVRPAEDAGVFVETALVERLTADAAGEPGVLPLVQETLVLLWERLQRRFLPVTAYEALVLPNAAYHGHGVTGLQVAMARRADATLATLSEPQQALARRTFLRLVQFGEGRADTRRQQRLSDLRVRGDDAQLLAQTLKRLTDNALLTLSGEERGDPRVDIAHEALITGWPTLQGWINDRRASEQIRRRLADKAAEWMRLGSGAGGLLDEIELLEAVRWIELADGADLGYDQAISDFIAASRAAVAAEVAADAAARQHELAQAQALAEAATIRAKLEAEAARRLRLRVWLFGGAGVIAVLFALTGFYLYYAANKQRRIAQSLALSADAARYLETDTETSLALAVKAYTTSATSQAENMVRQALLANHTVRLLSGHTAEVWGAAWRPDGKYLATSDQSGAILIWDVATGKVQTKLVGHRGTVKTVVWSPDGTALASASSDQTIQIWDLRDLSAAEIKHSRFLIGHTDGVGEVAWHPGGRWLASSGRDNTLRIWDLTTDRTAMIVDEQTGEINSLAWSPSGDRLAYGADDTLIRIWQTADLLALTPSSCAYRSLTPSVGQLPGDLRQARDATCIPSPAVVLRGHSDQVLSVAWRPDGRVLASGCNDGEVRLWNASGGPSTDTLVGHALSVNSVAWSSDGLHLASASFDTTVRIWNTRDGNAELVLTGHSDWVFGTAWSPDGHQIVTVAADHEVRIYDARPNESVIVLKDHGGEARALAWDRTGQQLASAGYEGSLTVWDEQTHLDRTVWRRPGAYLHDVKWSPVDDRLAFIVAPKESRDGSVLVWGAGVTTTLASADRGGYQLAWRPDGTELAVASLEGSVRVFDPSGGRLLRTYDGGAARFLSVDWSSDGARLALGGTDGDILVLNATTLQPLGTYSGHNGRVWGVSWSPDGRWLASASQDKTVRLWDAKTFGPAAEVLTDYKLAVNSVRWQPNSHALATSSDDRTVRVWDLGQRRTTAVLTGPTSGFWTVDWTPDGHKVAAGTVDGEVWIYFTEFNDVMDIARRQDGRKLTDAQIEAMLDER